MWSDNADIFKKEEERVDGEWGDNADISKTKRLNGE